MMRPPCYSKVQMIIEEEPYHGRLHIIIAKPNAVATGDA